MGKMELRNDLEILKMEMELRLDALEEAIIRLQTALVGVYKGNVYGSVETLNKAIFPGK